MSDSLESAFEILLEEMETIVAHMRKVGSEAMSEGLYEKVKDILQKAEVFEEVQDTVWNLSKKCKNLLKEEIFGHNEAEEDIDGDKRVSKNFLGRISKGKLLPQEEYEIPILQALVELGGKAHKKKVTERVGKILKSRFTKYDYLPVPTAPDTQRWKNRVAWCRYELVKKEFLEKPRVSGYGVWQITKKGRNYLDRES